MQVTKDKVVTLVYDVCLAIDGRVVDRTTEDKPLRYLHGHNNLIKGLEKAMENRQKGDKFDVRVLVDEAYGPHRPELARRVPKEIFKGDEGDQIKIGVQLMANTEDGPVPVFVTHIEENHIVVDANHILAGHDLDFSVAVIDIRDANEEEIANGVPSDAENSQEDEKSEHCQNEGGCGCNC